ncbi:ComEC family competence protein [Candidatus Nomurabacteria bacterium]|nr:ComEC family competence protein [Candidatus Nomurabacteria bacterium]
MRDKIFYAICFGFIFGVFLRSFIFVNFYFTVLLGVVSFALTLFFTLIRPRPPRATESNSKWGIIFSVFILIFSLGMLRFHVVDKPAPYVFESQVGNKISFLGKIIDEPDIRENNQKLIIEVGASPTKTKILATVDFGTYFQYGDEVNFSGKLEKPRNFTTDQGKDFDYINYLRKDGIFYVMNYVDIEIISRGGGNKIKNTLFYIKDKFLNKMNLVISRPESLLMGGLILGERSSFDNEMRQKFIDTGTIHIVALSGYNVTIVAEWIMKLFSQVPYVPKNFGIGMGIFAILFFILMTGGNSTAIRAGIMATLVLVARATGRNYDVARALIFAGVGMILLNPFILVYDVSFQLSFIATVAVIFLAPRIEKYFLWVPDYFKLRDIMTVTCSAYIFVLPFILYKMGNLSLVALPANILILPFIPFTMLFGFLTGFVGLIWYGFGVPLGFISYLFLHYELSVISFFSNLPFTSFSIPNFPLLLTIVIYIYFIYRLFGKSIKNFIIEPF